MPLKTQPIDPSVLGRPDGTRVYWLGNAGVLIDSRGTVLLIDPVITMVEKDGESRLETGHRLKVDLPILAEDLKRVDAVLLTHADGDHFGKRTAQVLGRNPSTHFYAPPVVCRALWDLGVVTSRITEVFEGSHWETGASEIVVTPAMHDWNPENPWKREDCCGFLVRTGDGVIWHPGDSRLLEELEAVKGVDVLFFDVAEARAHLGPSGSTRLAQTSGAKHLIAYHYGTLDVPRGGPFGSEPEDCMHLVRGLDATFHILNPGEPLIL